MQHCHGRLIRLQKTARMAAMVCLMGSGFAWCAEIVQMEYVRPSDNVLNKLTEVREGKVYYVDDANGNDTGEGARDKPWKTEEHALKAIGKDDILVFGGSYYVDARKGNDANDGSKDKPWRSIGYALKTIKGGDEVLVAPGLYVEKATMVVPAGPDNKRRTTLRLNGENRFLNRAVITGEDGYLSRFKHHVLVMSDNTRVKGLWFGGRQEKPGNNVLVFAARDVDIVENIFFNAYQTLAGTGAKRILIKDNLFVHLGEAMHFHPIYFSGGPNALGSTNNSHDLWCVGNVFINGEGTAIHGWHRPANMTVVGNFAAGHVSSLVLEGGGHIAHHNFFWKETGILSCMHFHQKGDNPNDQLADPRYRYNVWLANCDQFHENILGDEYPVVYPEAVGYSNNYATHVKEKLKDNYILPRSRLGAGDWCMGQVRLKLVTLPFSWYSHSEAEVEEAVQFMDRYFDWIRVDPGRAFDSYAGVFGFELHRNTWRKLAMSYNILHIEAQPKPEEIAPRPLPSGPAVSDREDGIK